VNSYELLEQELLDEYEPRLIAQGYNLIRLPSSENTPDFLGQYRPDAIAVGRKPSLIIEVMQKGHRSSAMKIERIRKLVEEQPDWQLEILFLGASSETLQQASNEMIENTLQGAKDIADKEPRAAFLLLWATLEAIMRRLEPQRSQKPQSPGRVVEVLAGQGFIAPSQADEMRRLIQTRNRIIHGELGVIPKVKEVNYLSDTINGLLQLIKQSGAKGETFISD
jgi:uncharacterized protein YutE (UPF0331/DUF86 family)